MIGKVLNELGDKKVKKKFDIVVTRHKALVEYLRELGIDVDKVVKHASPSDVKGKVVCGVLPHSLSCLAKEYWEVSLALPQELRGKELSKSQIESYAKGLIGYKVKVIGKI